MFGIFRYVLALLVAFGHIRVFLQGNWNWTGLYSVFGFFLLSGYLMTRVLHETYGYGLRGFVSYIANRCLRIYPAYWLVLVLTLNCLSLAPDFPGTGKSMLHLPSSTYEYFRSVVLLGLDWTFRPLVVPPAWSLHLELCFYILIGLGLSRTWWSTALWVAATVGGTAWAVAHGVSFGERYTTLAGASLPFALGAGLYFVRWSVPRGLLFAALVLFFVDMFATPFLWTNPKSPSAFYVSLALIFLVVAGLREIRPSGRLAVWDKRLGNLSYPIFLVHSQVGYMLGWLHWAPLGSYSLFFVSLPVIHILAVGIHVGVIEPIEGLRGRVRSLSHSVVARGLARAPRWPALNAAVRRFAPAIAVAGSLLLGALAGEGALRLAAAMFPPPPASPLPADTKGLPTVEGLFALAKPNQRSNYRGALYTTNSRGLRGPEIEMPKPADVFRMAVLGDSYAMGSGVRYEEAFPELTASTLARTPDGRRVEPVNLALAGLALRPIVNSRLPLALNADPDLLVYAWVINDLDGAPGFHQTLAPYKPPGPSLLVNLLRERWKYARDIFWPSPTSYLGQLNENFFHNPEVWSGFEDDLERLAEAGRSKGICVVAFILPEMQILSRLHPYFRFYDAVADAARRHGIYVVEGFPAFLGKDPVGLRCSPMDWHPNAEAHAILAAVLTDGLRHLPESCWAHRSPADPAPHS